MKRKKGLTALLIALLILVAALAAAGAYLKNLQSDPMRAFNEASTPTPAAPGQSGAPQTGAPGEATPEPTISPLEALKAAADADFMKNRVNILLLGWDESPERNDESSALYRDEENNFRSDVIMLLTVDFENKTVDLISVPRDTYAPIYNVEGHFKINAAFAKGGSAKGDGFNYAMNTVASLLGVPIRYYAGVNMAGMKAVVDAMGGVDYDVDLRIVLNGRVLEKGMQHLNGQQVLDYCRARKGYGTDVNRADRQQRMLFAIFNQLKSRNQLVNLPNVYLGVKDYIDTNLNFDQIAALSMFALDFDTANLRRHTLAGEYISGTPYNGASFYVLKNDALRELVREIFGVSLEPDPRYDIAYVQADKAAADALAYVTGSQNILGILQSNGLYTDPAAQDPYAPAPAWDIQELLSAMEQVNAAAVRVIPASLSEEKQEALLKTPFDTDAISASVARIRQAMWTVCLNYGLYKEHFTKALLPEEFYSILPAYADTLSPRT
ncbi:MAG: LCP family protein [Clostridiaceae bacterium]|nr:LCP family protein [Eubacteriales bacterium]